jgi:alkyl hydroperoxide reductase subunit F
MLDAISRPTEGLSGKVSHPIEIVASLDDSAKSREMQELLQEIVLLSTDQAGRATRLRPGRTPSFS